jgi:CubicO group peptidase (beta-lactamase class C family)
MLAVPTYPFPVNPGKDYAEVNMRTVLFLLLIPNFLTCAAQSTPVMTGGDESTIKQVVDGYMEPFLAKTAAPGAIVGVSLHGQRYFYTYGEATDNGSPFTPDTLVEIGSCTKVFTTTLFALAVGRNQISPDAGAQKYMPDGFTLQQPNAQQMTPLELADFTSGLPDDPTNLPKGLEQRGIKDYTVHDLLSWISGWEPANAPPAPYLYSNAGIGLLSFLVATATHQPWDPQLKREILGPLSMGDTELRPSEKQQERLAQGHRENGTPAPPWPIYAWFAAGGLRSTATDMLRFGEANLGHSQVDGKPVSAELIAAMKSAQAPIYLMPSGNSKQGMAWVVNLGDGEPQIKPEILKDGGTVGFSTVILLNPAKDLAIFIAVNKQQARPSPIAVTIGRHLASAPMN